MDYGEAGLLLPPKDSEALANMLMRLLNDSNKLREWKNRACQNLKRLNVNRVCQETLEVYQELKKG